MTVTVCVPVWNAQKFVEETLESVRGQTLKDIFVLVSVDRSDDNSADICRAFAARDPRFKIFVQPQRLGWIGNVNWLLRRVQSESASILPHDDVLAPSCLERLISELDCRPDAVLAFCDIQTFGRRERVRVGPETTGELFARIVDFLYANVAANAWRGVFRSKVLDRGCYLDEGNGAAADQVWLLRLAIEGCLIRVPEVLYRKRLHAESVVAKAKGVPAYSHWADHCVSCHRLALGAGQWTHRQKQAIAAAVLMRAMRLPNVTRSRSTPSEIAASLLTLAADYTLRLSNLAPSGSSVMAPTDLPNGLRAHLDHHLSRLSQPRPRSMPNSGGQHAPDSSRPRPS